ncbi:MAG: SRPBCC family protein [Planctomycetota bacterium]
MENKIEIPPIRCNTYINASPDRVWRTLTTAEGWDAWFTQGAKVDPRPGGEIFFKWVNFKVDRYTLECLCPVLEAEAPHRFVFQWKAGDSTTTIAFDLEPRGPGTVVRVEESGHGTSKKDLAALVECASGWGEALTLLKFYLEHGVTFGDVPEE